MNAQELALNIAVNMGRVSRWATEGRIHRVRQFIEETEDYLEQLENTPKNPRFHATLEAFKKEFTRLKNNIQLNERWAEDALTWANILTHRAKLA